MTVYELLEQIRQYVDFSLVDAVAEKLSECVAVHDDKFPTLDNEFVLLLLKKAARSSGLGDDSLE